MFLSCPNERQLYSCFSTDQWGYFVLYLKTFETPVAQIGLRRGSTYLIPWKVNRYVDLKQSTQNSFKNTFLLLFSKKIFVLAVCFHCAVCKGGKNKKVFFMSQHSIQRLVTDEFFFSNTGSFEIWKRLYQHKYIRCWKLVWLISTHHFQADNF